MNFVFRICRRTPSSLKSIVRTFTVTNLEPRLIQENHQLQFYYGGQFLENVKRTRNWGDLKEAKVMDIGCGAGNNSTKLILDLFPDVGEIIGTDASADLIQLAIDTNCNPNVEFFVADIQDENAYKNWFGTASKVVSMFTLHWVEEQRKAFQNIYDLLQPGGEAALIFPLTSKNYNANAAIYSDPKWKEFLKKEECFVSESQVKHFDAFHYQNIFLEIGFKVLLCEEDPKNYVFQTDKQCANFLKSLFPDINKIPYELEEEVGEDLLKVNVSLCGRSGDGRPNFKFNPLNIMLLKS